MNISESVERLVSKVKDMLEIDYVKDVQELIMLESHIDCLSQIVKLKLCVNVRLIDLETTVLMGNYMNSGEFYKCTFLAGKLREYISKTKQLLNYGIS